jgi:uncharacterized protein (DUF1330 family)
MPKGYIIARIVVTNPEQYADYVKDASAAIQKYGGRPLVRGGAMTELEGEGRPRNVVIEFESVEQAKRYYHSPEYQAAKKKREGAGYADIVAVEGAA